MNYLNLLGTYLQQNNLPDRSRKRLPKSVMEEASREEGVEREYPSYSRFRGTRTPKYPIDPSNCPNKPQKPKINLPPPNSTSIQPIHQNKKIHYRNY